MLRTFWRNNGRSWWFSFGVYSACWCGMKRRDIRNNNGFKLFMALAGFVRAERTSRFIEKPDAAEYRERGAAHITQLSIIWEEYRRFWLQMWLARPFRWNKPQRDCFFFSLHLMQSLSISSDRPVIKFDKWWRGISWTGPASYFSPAVFVGALWTYITSSSDEPDCNDCELPGWYRTISPSFVKLCHSNWHEKLASFPHMWVGT